MSTTWALFAWKDGEWVFCGLTEHEEMATEFEEYNADDGIATEVVALEAPSRRMDTVAVKGLLL